jgi:uncharacterized protein YbcI
MPLRGGNGPSAKVMAQRSMDVNGGQGSGQATLVGGELNAAVTREITRIHTAGLGRGPKKAFTVHRDSVMVTIMEDVMTKAERKLIEAGDGDKVLEIRHRLQHAVADEMKEAVERLTGRRVAAFMSDSHLEPDMAAEVFVLDGPPGAS